MAGEFLAWRRRGGYKGLPDLYVLLALMIMSRSLISLYSIHQRWCRWVKKHPKATKNQMNGFKVPRYYVQPLMERVAEEERKKKSVEMEAGGSSSRHVNVDEEIHDEVEDEDEALGEEDQCGDAS